jgi:two-component system, NtrC family, nitrogen regulation response regulator NtrX
VCREGAGNVSRRVLVVDDEAGVRDALALLLDEAGYESVTASGAEAALVVIEREEIALVLCDVAMPGMDGIALVERLHRTHRELPVVMVSAHAELETAVRAVRAGAYDFLQKPIDEKRLFVTIERGLEWAQMRGDLQRLRGEQEEEQELLGESPPMGRLREEIRRAAPSDSRILILGEAGTGKELVARALHEGSRRCERPFVKVNSAAIPRDLVESELFGHEAGAFTGATKARRGKFEQADGGTLFLDEIADMAPEAQAKLLRVLAAGEVERVGGTRPLRVDVRVICATNRDLAEEIREGTFREDLYHRVAVIPIVVPPLRDRGQDVLLLAARFLARFSIGYREAPPALEAGAQKRLLAHSWPGNVRELRNLAERIAIMHDQVRVSAADLDRYLAPPELPGAASVAHGQAGSFAGESRPHRGEEERTTLERVLHETGWNVTLAADRLGIDRRNLHRTMRRLGIARPSRSTGDPGLDR